MLDDVIQEKFTAAHAREAYGVVILDSPPGVDEDATARLRADMTARRGPLDLQPAAVPADR